MKFLHYITILGESVQNWVQFDPWTIIIIQFRVGDHFISNWVNQHLVNEWICISWTICSKVSFYYFVLTIDLIFFHSLCRLVVTLTGWWMCYTLENKICISWFICEHWTLKLLDMWTPDTILEKYHETKIWNLDW